MDSVNRTHRAIAAGLAAGLTVGQLACPPRAAASPAASAASAGAVAPPSLAAIQAFQPDLFTGRASMSIPLAVPAGRRGMHPSLALSYSSSSRNGWLGVGWTLELGAIERSTTRGVPAYNDSADTFTLSFQGAATDLVAIPDGTYRAKTEGAFLRIARSGAGWEARDTSGTRYLFGQSSAARVESGAKIFRWALDQVVDPNGNGLTVAYTKDQGQLYPARILYTTTTVADGPAPVNQIDLNLDNRSDQDVSYRATFPVTTAKRLKSIEMKVSVAGSLTLARRYDFSYVLSQRTSRSLLASVTQVGRDGSTTLPPTSFSYQHTQAPTYALAANNPATTTPAWNVRVAVADLGDSNYGAVPPYAGLPWGEPRVVQGTGQHIGCVTVNAYGNGALDMTGCQDTHVHAWTWLYTSAPRQLSLAFDRMACDSNGAVWQEDANGLQRITDGRLNLQPGWSLLHVTDYHQHACFSDQLTSPMAVLAERMSPTQFVAPQLAGDVDGNGITDLITFEATATAGTWRVSLSRAGAFSPSAVWATFGDASWQPLLGDWDGDGRTDVALYKSGQWQFATVNPTDSGFLAGSPASVTFGGGTPLIGDFNGDGRADLGTYTGGAWSVALGTGGGFTPDSAFTVSFGSSGHDPLTGDFNGDGLTDIATVNKSTGAIDLRLSMGTGFAPAASALGSFGGGQPHLSGDINGDGLTDALFYDRTTRQFDYAVSTGAQFSNPSGTSLPPVFTLAADTDVPQLADVNGDGLLEPAVFSAVSGAAELARSTGTFPDLLSGVANGLGGSATIDYEASTLCDNICPVELVPKLPFVLPLVRRVTADNGLGHRVATSYHYLKGRYDPVDREFVGFARVEVRDPLGNVAITEFHQDPHRKGRPFLMEVRDAAGNLWTRTAQAWSCLEPFPNVHFTKLDRAQASACDGDAVCKTTAASFAYDAANGNLVRVDEEGDVEVPGLERSTVTSYALNTVAWILNRPRLVQTLDAQGQIIAQQRFFYDGAADLLTPPTKGNLTGEEEWLDRPAAAWLRTTLAYDTLGNLSQVTDALGRVTRNGYDPTGTYLTSVTNDLGHVRAMTYDPTLGVLTSSTDPNGVKTATEYDALARVAKVVGPNDTSKLPTLRYDYDPCLTTAGCTAPIRSTAYARVLSGQPAELATHTFVDGLGRPIQIRAPAEAAGKQIVTGAVELDARGLVAKQWAPYVDAASTAYVPVAQVSGVAPPVTYSYDPLGRATLVVNPDRSTTATLYADWAVTTIDPNTNQVRRTQDALGRLATVEEFNAGQVHTTAYRYDALGRLLQITDAARNVTQMTYDALGRKVSMDDPDMGRWTYAYDAVGNLTAQTDARGVRAQFVYDRLNRLISRNSTDLPPGIPPAAPVVYTYDVSVPAQPYANGRLVKITDGSGTSEFVYDNLGRLTEESKTLDGARYTIRRAYDALGRLTALTYPDGELARYTYNSQGGIDSIALDSAAGTSPLITNIDYTAAGQVSTLAYANGVTTTQSYDPQTLRMVGIATQAPGGTLQNFSYGFDPAGNLKTVTDAIHSGTQSFTYDPLNRLTQATGSYGTLAYRYDALGNLLEKEGLNLGYGLADGAKPHAVTSLTLSGQPAVTLKYDSNGNLLEKPAPDSPLLASTFVYDADNRLVEARTPQEESITATFAPGWNFFSLPVIPTDTSMASLFPTFAADFAQITRYEAGTYRYHVGDGKFDDFSTLEYGLGYQVYCKNPAGASVTFTGRTPSKSATRSLSPGWHLLAGIALEPSPTSSVFAGVDQTAIRAYSAATGSLTTAAQTAPSQAYYVSVRSASTWSPPLPRDVKTSFAYDGDGGRVKQITSAGTTKFLGQAYEIAPDGKTTKYVFAGAQRVAAIETSPGQADAPQSSPSLWARWWRGILDALALSRAPLLTASRPP